MKIKLKGENTLFSLRFQCWYSIYVVKPFILSKKKLINIHQGLNEIYVWFLLPTYPNFFNPTLNIKMVFGEKIPKIGTFYNFVTIFFVKCYNKI